MTAAVCVCVCVTAAVRDCVRVPDAVCEAVRVLDAVRVPVGEAVRVPEPDIDFVGECESGSKSQEAATVGDAVADAENDSERVSEGVSAGVPVRVGVCVRAADQEAGLVGAGA